MNQIGKIKRIINEAVIYDGMTTEDADSIEDLLMQIEKEILRLSSCRCNEPSKCRNCDEMVVLVSSGEFCPSCYC